ncbi:MAG TPA: CDGSH iron-sulfur domain-containing protein [Gemmatimonadales bacterium]|nr:CDGSH iron-sulfur domain-containing protein [Gemmatimonadales bacterium]
MPACRITVRAHGPLRVEGDFEIVDREGRPFGLGGRRVVSLCRCGQSASKPFCDGSHGACGFRDEGEARDLPPRPAAG